VAKFHVIDTFALQGRGLFVLAGFIMDGVIRPGQFVRISLNSGLKMSAQIEAIEFARRSQHREDVCLCMSYTSLIELEMLQGLNIDGETVEVTE
jgi:hypothetical protein